MIKEYMVGYVPSLSSLRILKKRQLNKPKPSFDLLAVGNISYGSNGEVADQASGALFELGFPQVINLPALKYSALEIQNISRFFKKSRVTVLSQDKASERKLRSLTLSDFKIIHFATHSLIDDKRPARSAVVLSRIENQSEDGLLQAREIFNLNLNADLVTLSACQSGLGQFIRGEGIEGLSRAFFYAGSSSVLMSLWAVNDQATCQLMERFYRHLRRSESLMDALRSAKREMIDTGAVSHPYYWAGFIVNGKVDTQVFSGNRYASALLIGTLGVAVVFLLGIAFRRHNKA
jgi:CHAT domain-containing protein